MKKKKQTRTMDLEEKIYLICYSKPRFITEIAKIIYDDKTSSYPTITGKDGIVAKMVKAGKLQGKKFDRKQMKVTDGRAKKRQYYLSKIDQVYIYIVSKLKEKKITLNSEEDIVVKEFLNSNEFREMVEFAFPIDGLFIESRRKNISINPEYIISYLFFHYSGIFYAIKSILEKMDITEEKLLSTWGIKSSEKNYKKDLKTKYQDMYKNSNLTAAMSLRNMSFDKAIEMNNFNKRFLKLNKSLLEKLMKTDLGFKKDPSLILTLFELFYNKKC